jgi:hypothetical protein
MKTVSVKKAAADFEAFLAKLERDQEEVILVRGRKVIARIVPEYDLKNAPRGFSDLPGTMDAATSKALKKAVEKGRRSFGSLASEMKNLWDS